MAYLGLEGRINVDSNARANTISSYGLTTVSIASSKYLGNTFTNNLGNPYNYTLNLSPTQNSDTLNYSVSSSVAEKQHGVRSIAPNGDIVDVIPNQCTDEMEYRVLRPAKNINTQLEKSFF